jgi:serine/threonine protein kinase
LPVGTLIGEFEVTRILGGGGFGIVYLAYDHALHRRVAIKEYMPTMLAERVPGEATVRANGPNSVESFRTGLRSFVNEARVLAQLDHPALVKVYHFWEQHGTAYMVMPYYSGVTLKAWLANLPEPPDEATLRGLLVPLLEALEVMHEASIYHRDIAPDNILVLSDGRPVLLDFGAARQVLGEMSQDLTTILKPGYAPVEQYSALPHQHQGAYTDLYALGALIYFAITRSRPPASIDRMVSDTMRPAVDAGSGRYSEAFLRAVDRCLAVPREGRPQSVQELRELLGIATSPTPPVRQSLPEHDGKPSDPSRPPHRLAAGALWTFGLIAAALIAAVAWHGLDGLRLPTAETNVSSGSREPAGASSAQTPAPSGDVASTLPQPREQGEARIDPIAVLRSLHDMREREWKVTVHVDRTPVRIGRDRPSFRVASGAAGYVYVFRLGTDAGDLAILFPNAIDSGNRIGKDGVLALPRKGWRLVADGPAGTNYLLVLVSAVPRDFGSAGLRKGDPFDEFPLPRIAELAKANGGSYDFFAGTPVCASEPCDRRFGATLATIEQVE